MKLILVPLLFLLIPAILSMMGLGSYATSFEGEMYDPTRFTAASGSAGWYDTTGHLVMYNNGTVSGESGTWRMEGTGSPSYSMYSTRFWWNNGTQYEVYNTPDGESKFASTYFDGQFVVTDSLGIIVLVGTVMGLATIAGVRVMGSGPSDSSVSTIIIGSGLITLWLVFSVTAMPLITSVPLLGNIFYFLLTLLYTVGIISRIGGSGT